MSRPFYRRARHADEKRVFNKRVSQVQTSDINGRETIQITSSRKTPQAPAHRAQKQGNDGSTRTLLTSCRFLPQAASSKSVISGIPLRFPLTGWKDNPDRFYIIQLKEIFETPLEITLVLELVTGGELFDRIVERGYYSERDAAHVIKQILEAVAYLHDNGVVHRDLKPENLLYADRSPDAPLKIAPEILRGAPYGSEVDMWSVGVITYILLCGFEPFFDLRGDQYMYSRILTCDYEFVSPWWDDVSLNAKDLVSKLIVLDPLNRLNVQQALQHPWVSGKAAHFSHMDTTQKKLQEFNARRKLKAAVKAVVATSRIGNHRDHEGSRNSRQPECEAGRPNGNTSEAGEPHSSSHLVKPVASASSGLTTTSSSKGGGKSGQTGSNTTTSTTKGPSKPTVRLKTSSTKTVNPRKSRETPPSQSKKQQP
ncbi:KCC4 kinase, partial [Polypterus senegalus]